MKKINFTLLNIFAFGLISQAQYVGDPTVYSVDFTNNSLYYQGVSQGNPLVTISSNEKSVVWATNAQPVILKHSVLDANYSTSSSQDVLISTGNQNTTAEDVQHAIEYDSNSGKYLSVYRHNFYQGSNKDYSLKAILYDANGLPATPFYIEGPFIYTSDAPSMPSIAVNDNSVFCVAYHSSLTSGSSSTVKVKFVDAITSSVTPLATSGNQTGVDLTFQGAQHPSVAWNSNTGVFGIVYTTGSGNNQKIKFVSCDATGAVVTAEKDLIADNQIQVQYPKIYADGNDFVIIWRDYRQIAIGANSPISGIPALRITQIDASGNLKNLTGQTDVFDSNDNSLMLSNPYISEVYYKYDLKVISPNQKYAVVWNTQDVVPSVKYSTVEVNGSNIKSSIAITISNNGSNSFTPSIAYDNLTQKYVVTYYEHNGTNYENRICVGVQSTINQVGISEKKTDDIKIFPNPAKTNFQISNAKIGSEITIYNVKGEKVYHLFVTSQNPIVNIADFKSGLYIVEIKGKNRVIRQKMIKS